MSANSTDESSQFLAGGGEMGALIRQKDWSKTPIGHAQTWPQSLRTALGIVLHSKFPMFLWWGPELICFYNDAYRPSLGENGKHPSILGQPAREAWSEIWDIIHPLIDQVLAGGESTWSEDQLIPIYRNGKMEDVYWTFSYSRVNDESNLPVGVLVTCSETTEKVKILQEIKESEAQLNFAIDAAELGTWDLNPVTKRFIGNSRLKEWFGLAPEDEIALPLALNNIVEDDRQNVIAAIQSALQPGSEGSYTIEYTIVNPVNQVTRRVLAKGKAIFDDHGQACRFSGTLQDVTEQAKAREKVEESEKRFRNIVEQAPLGIAIFRGPDFIVETANETYLQLVDKKESDFVGNSLFASLPEIKERVAPLLTQVLHTGIHFQASEFAVTLHRYGKQELSYFNMVYHPLRTENEGVWGIMVVATEVTASVKAKQLLAESEKQFRNLVMQSPIPMTIFKGQDHVIEIANTVMFEKIWRKKEQDIVGKKLVDVFPELREQKYPELLNKVYTSGQAHRENEAMAYVQGDDGLRKFYFDFEYTPFLDTDGAVSGIVVTLNDVTAKVETRKQIEEAEERLRLAAEATELATWDLDLQTRQIIYSSRLPEIFGLDEMQAHQHLDFRHYIHPDDTPIVEQAFEMALQLGIYRYEARVLRPDHTICWIRTQGKVFYDEENKPLKLIGTLRDITEEKLRQQALQESEQKFRLLADSMPQHIWTADPQGNLNYYNRSVFDYSGLNLAQIEAGGWLQIVHPDDREANVEAWLSAVTTGQGFLFEHRFRRHDGAYRWQLSRAIPQRDASGNIQMWVGTSTDIQDQKTFANELEKQVRERTAELEEKNKELEKMNAELESFAYVSSHDLQEPLRKIQTFASLLLEKEHQNLSENGKDHFRRMWEAANRMQTLILDLLEYSRTNTAERTFKKVYLQEIMAEIKQDFKEALIEKQAVLEIGPLCEATIIPFQFRQLMHNLIGNALKFAKPGIPPHITINNALVVGKALNLSALSPEKIYCHLCVSDNGIGFDPQYKERIFEVFQRLHGKSEYKGTGIGLAIVKKIVENHHGLITATGEVNKGATFDIYLPAS